MITSVFTNGLGNRLFTMSKLLAEADQKKLEPVFIKEVCLPNKHCPVNSLFALFPQIKIVQNADVKVLQPHIITTIDDKFIKEKHFVNDQIRLPKMPKLLNTFFVHFRRGDYTQNSNYTDLSLTSYYEDALKHFPTGKVVIFSNDIQWVKKHAMHLFKNYQVEFDMSEDEIISLAKMASCSLGGISANSTFGFWGLELNEGRTKILPSPFPCKNLWPLSTEITKNINDFKIITIKGQNNYSIFIAFIMIIIITVLMISSIKLSRLLRKSV